MGHRACAGGLESQLMHGSVPSHLPGKGSQLLTAWPLVTGFHLASSSSLWPCLCCHSPAGVVTGPVGGVGKVCLLPLFSAPSGGPGLGWVGSGSDPCPAASWGGARWCHLSLSQQWQGVFGGDVLPASDPGNKFIWCRDYNLFGAICPPWVGVLGLRGDSLPARGLGPAFSFCTGAHKLHSWPWFEEINCKYLGLWITSTLPSKHVWGSHGGHTQMTSFADVCYRICGCALELCFAAPLMLDEAPWLAFTFQKKL